MGIVRMVLLFTPCAVAPTAPVGDTPTTLYTVHTSVHINTGMTTPMSTHATIPTMTIVLYQLPYR